MFNRLDKYRKLLKKTNSFELEIDKLSQEELQAKTKKFQKELAEQKDDFAREKYLHKILPEAYALVREVGKRVLGKRHYDVQIIGGAILHDGNIAEMRTGEGKTLVETLPAYLNALIGRGVHIITVNDYLAKRDREEMGKIFEYLGLTVGLIQNDMHPSDRKENYNKDITYVTNTEIGFDYLRDNMAKTQEEKVMRELYYAIIDEVDSILIDEARTPLIISRQMEPEIGLYEKADKFAKMIEVGTKKSFEGSQLQKQLMSEKVEVSGDVIVDRKERYVNLTDEGIEKAEKYFGIENIGDIENSAIMHHISNALKANYLFKKDTDYIVRDGKVEIVDEFTGRVLKGRQYSEGLHQAIEAKEYVKISPESKTMATVTYQNLFRLYYKISGMTGTGKTEEEEFREIYDMEVLQVPTNKPIARVDKDDLVFKTKKEKYIAIAKDIKNCYEIKRPVLVGTPNIEESEIISSMLKNLGIPHNVLNAKFHEQEAEIISQAGKVGAITVATNMAGRGTDIIVEEESKKLGGLKVIGIERHEARRIDDQLRGRTGRQGDVGESVFYISLEDDLMKLFANKSHYALFDAMQIPKGEPIEHKMLTKSIRKAQKQIEGMNYGIRKNVIKYDEIIAKQRESIYKDRDRVLNGDIFENFYGIIEIAIDFYVQKYFSKEVKKETYEEYISRKLKKHLGIELLEDEIENREKEYLVNLVKNKFESKINEFDKSKIETIIQNIFLEVVDKYWQIHIEDISELNKGISLRSYKQQDPVQEFIMESKKIYTEMVWSIQTNTIKKVFTYNFSAILNNTIMANIIINASTVEEKKETSFSDFLEE